MDELHAVEEDFDEVELEAIQAAATPGRTFAYPADAPSRPCPTVLRSPEGRCSFVKFTYDHNIKRINAFCMELIAKNPVYNKQASETLVAKHGPDGGHQEHCADYMRRSRDEGYGHPQPRGPRAPATAPIRTFTPHGGHRRRGTCPSRSAARYLAVLG